MTTLEERQARRKKRNELLDKDVKDWTTAELIDVLTERYRPTEVPPCSVCGGELSMVSVGGGDPTRWACTGQEDDPDRPGFVRTKEGRTPTDGHYEKSLFIDRRQGGDEVVMEAVRRLTPPSSRAGT